MYLIVILKEKVFDIVKFLSGLKTLVHGRSVLYYPVMPSTQSILVNRFHGMNQGLLSITDYQTQGTGRGKNKWDSPYGCLMFSFKSTIPHSSLLPPLQYLISIAVVKGIKNIPGCEVLFFYIKIQKLDIQIKWPNDIYAKKTYKIGGILCQSIFSHDGFDVTSGVGINVLNSHPTTCLQDLLYEQYPKGDAPILTREKVLDSFLNEFVSMFIRYKHTGFKPFIREYTKYWLHTNQKITVNDREGKQFKAVVKGINDQGYLIAKINDTGEYTELYPDGNRFDFFKGLVMKRKTEEEKLSDSIMDTA